MGKRRQVPKSGFRPGVGKLKTAELLRELRAQRARIEAEQKKLVAQAREEGATWKEIAEMTGMNSHQAAQYRFGRASTATK